MDLKLIEAGSGDIKKEYKFLRNIKEENGFQNVFYKKSFFRYKNKYLPRLVKDSHGEDLPDGYVPQTLFFLYDEETIVGIFKVRHYCNDFTRNSGIGHIGYGIGKKFRGRGYAKNGLKLAIDKLLSMSDYDKNDGVIMGCRKDNIASLKVQEYNGAKIIGETETDYITQIK